MNALIIAVAQIRASNPLARQAEIAREINYSGERVRQILKELGLPAKPPLKVCVDCGKRVDSRTKRCRPCYHQYILKNSWVELPCHTCKAMFPRRKSDFKRSVKNRQRLFFCSKHCLGVWVAVNYGFGVYPEHRSPRKWDYSLVYLLRDGKQWGALRISRALHIPQSTVSDILRKGKRK